MKQIEPSLKLFAILYTYIYIFYYYYYYYYTALGDQLNNYYIVILDKPVSMLNVYLQSSAGKLVHQEAQLRSIKITVNAFHYFIL